MPQYYNLTWFSQTNDIIGIYSTTDILLKGFFSLFLIFILCTFITMVRMRRGDNFNNALMLGSFFSMLFAGILYISGVFSVTINYGLYIFVPSIIFITTVIIKFYKQ
jgi:hypothetical protein